MDVLSRQAAVFIVRQILKNFYLHIKTMYYEKPHGNGTLKQEDLTRIKIGNEYDVQRILYSLLKLVFPKARVEVNSDSGYSGFRYDIYLDEYNMVIEVKCSRSNMTEKSLTDELDKQKSLSVKRERYLRMTGCFMSFRCYRELRVCLKNQI